SSQDVGLLVVLFLSNCVLLQVYLSTAHMYRGILTGSRKDSSSSASHRLRCGPPGLPNMRAPIVWTSSSTLGHGRFYHSELVGFHGPFQTRHGHPSPSRKHAFRFGT